MDIETYSSANLLYESAMGQNNWRQNVSNNFVRYPQQGKRPLNNFAGLINECAKKDHNLLDDSMQIDFRDA